MLKKWLPGESKQIESKSADVPVWDLTTIRKLV